MIGLKCARCGQPMEGDESEQKGPFCPRCENPVSSRTAVPDYPTEAGEPVTSAGNVTKGGQDDLRRLLFVTAPGETPRKLLQIIQEKNAAQGKPAAQRADLRFDLTSAGQIFVLNKADGTIRVIER